jgi:enoyl-[acyl-carrier protein] reductase I
MHEHGARMAFSYAVESLERRVRPLAASVGATFVEPCDVSNDEQIDALFRRAAAELGVVDILVHAVAFAGRDELSRPYHLTSRAGFLNALDISAYS